ncbi:MAG: ABC transporter permease [Acidobacteria bacterium]|nr:ABC transporter permease [Acidobacteriota bacterium]
MRVAWAEFKRHLIIFLRLRQALFFTFAVPALFLILLGFAFDERRLELRIGVADEDQSAASMMFIEGLQRAQILRVSTGSEPELTRLLNKGELVSVLRIKAGFGAELGEKTTQLDVFYNQRQLQSGRIVFAVLNEMLIQMSREIPGREPLIEFNRIPVQSKNTETDVRYTDFLTPGIIVMSILYICLVPISNFVAARDAHILKRISLTPIRKSHFLAGYIAFQVCLCFVLLGILHALSKFLFGFSSQGSPLAVFALLLVGAAAFISLSFAIGSLAKNARSATGMVNMAINPMIFLGGVFYSTAALPSFFQPIVKVLPVSYFVDGLRKIMLDGVGLGHLWKEIAVLLVWGVISFLIAVKKLEWIPDADR